MAPESMMLGLPDGFPNSDTRHSHCPCRSEKIICVKFSKISKILMKLA